MEAVDVEKTVDGDGQSEVVIVERGDEDFIPTSDNSVPTRHMIAITHLDSEVLLAINNE